MAREDEIRLIAYRIWEENGCPDGCANEHWFRAEAIWQKQESPKSAGTGVKPSGPKAAVSAPSDKKATKKKTAFRHR